jgi:alpha-galactosidase
VTTIVFLGAGSVVFTRELLTDLLGFPEFADARIVLHDIDPERLATASALAGRIADAFGVRPSVVATLDRRAALDGADFVINAIQVGMYPATRVDFEVPARFGLRQTIGDTIGIGGIFRGLRTFPVLAGIAADMTELCPDAWLLNYTNPMAMNVTYLAKVAPRLKVLGLCHSVYWTVRGLCEIVDMYRRLGYYPTETSEHSAEYVPWYLRHDSEIDRLRIPVGDYLRVSEDNLASYAATRTAPGPIDLNRDTTEYAPQVIHSMVTGTPREIVANVANDGLIDNLPSGFAVEVPTIVDAAGAAFSPMGDLPPQLAAVNRPYVSVGELTVAAAVAGDPRLVRQAAMVDPNTAATLTVDAIWELCDALTAAHGDLLPEGLHEWN